MSIVLRDRPQLTLPAAEAAAVQAAYAEAGCILEYGSGGSTVLAAEMPGKTVFSVESDPAWAAGLRGWFNDNPTPSCPVIHHADIGPTREWGHPLDDRAIKRWPGYALSVWDRPDFMHPDVVLIDGRFRVACFLTVAIRITRPVTVLFDDYADRDAYHTVETLAQPVARIGRMARFELGPMPFPVDRMGWVIAQYLRPL